MNKHNFNQIEKKTYIEIKKVRARGCCLTAVGREKRTRVVAGSQSVKDLSIQYISVASRFPVLDLES
ncbi:hypothetical protein Bca4012_027098 [Brassica carinata]|uniref:Uncharacterized protein n=1 Tax=Brassica carinata TaxID=52824 RepID=A0A8X7VJK4_BRACI|nr:hypothetical protein Bca52824_024102 [Brassica carinata]